MKALSKATAEQILELVEKPLTRGETVLGRLDAHRAETGRPVHSELLKLLTHLAYPNDIARKVWAGYAVHRAELERRLGRDVGVRVALFDYLLNVDQRLTNPKIIEISDYEKTARSAITDHLSGLFNREHFDISLKREINRCRRYGQSASLLMMDLDDFKAVNDTRGHPAGDDVLKEVGRLLSQTVRDIDVAARYGGEEFGVILPETQRMSAFVVAERIRLDVERTFKRRNSSRDLHVTMSCGVASFPDDADSHESLLTRADEALYRAKREGKNRVAVYYKEKRGADRVDIASQGVRVVIHGSSTEGAGACRALNISRGGILLESDAPLKLGQSLEMRLQAEDDLKLDLLGEVVRLQELTHSRKKKFGAGVKFRFGRSSVPRTLSRLINQSA